MTGTSTDRPAPRILVIGGGYVGMYTALRLLRRLRDGEATVTVVDPRSYMTYQPFLPEAAAGSIQPRHVVVPLRRVLRGAEVISGTVLPLDHPRRVAQRAAARGQAVRDRLRPRRHRPRLDRAHAADPGLADWGTGFKNVEEAIELRNRVIECLDIAESTHDEDIRRRNLHLRGRRRRLRRDRGARRARGHVHVRDPLLPLDPARRHAVDARRGERPHPARGGRGHGPVHAGPAARARHRAAG